MRLQHIKLKPL